MASPGAQGQPWGSWPALGLMASSVAQDHLPWYIYIYILYKQASGTKQYTEAHPPLPSCRGSGGVMCLGACFGSGGVMRLCVCVCVLLYCILGLCSRIRFPTDRIAFGFGFHGRLRTVGAPDSPQTRFVLSWNCKCVCLGGWWHRGFKIPQPEMQHCLNHCF